ncbi:two-component system OmpR family response regulator [Paraburkholderia sp. GAS33]|jgi:DNA-binding response OmpR family regulator
MRILFVSPRHPEASWLYKALHESTHSLCRTHDVVQGVRRAMLESFDAVILMINDPGLYSDLDSALARLSAAARTAIQIVILAGATAQGRTAALRAGADACFARPFSFIEMHERLQALHRAALTRSRGDQQAVMPLRLDSMTRELVSGERRLLLTKTEYLLLECLMRQVNVPVPHEQLIRYAWPGKDIVTSSSVSPLIWRLRSKLKTHVPLVHINTVNCYGYQLSVLPG